MIGDGLPSQIFINKILHIRDISEIRGKKILTP